MDAGQTPLYLRYLVYNFLLDGHGRITEKHHHTVFSKAFEGQSLSPKILDSFWKLFGKTILKNNF